MEGVLKRSIRQNQPFGAGIHVALLEFGCRFGVLWEAVAQVLCNRFVETNVHAISRIELITFRGETKQH